MYITIAAITVFLLVLLVVMFLFPGKTEKDLPMEMGEKILFQGEGLSITRYPATGPRPIVWPGAKLTVSDKKLVIFQKGLGSSNLVIREIMLNEEAGEQSLSHSSNWGNVLVASLNYQKAFSLNGDLIVLKNPNATNLDRFEIKGIANPDELLNVKY